MQPLCDIHLVSPVALSETPLQVFFLNASVQLDLEF